MKVFIKIIHHITFNTIILLPSLLIAHTQELSLNKAIENLSAEEVSYVKQINQPVKILKFIHQQKQAAYLLPPLFHVFALLAWIHQQMSGSFEGTEHIHEITKKWVKFLEKESPETSEKLNCVLHLFESYVNKDNENFKKWFAVSLSFWPLPRKPSGDILRKASKWANMSPEKHHKELFNLFTQLERFGGNLRDFIQNVMEHKIYDINAYVAESFDVILKDLDPEIRRYFIEMYREIEENDGDVESLKKDVYLYFKNLPKMAKLTPVIMTFVGVYMQLKNHPLFISVSKNRWREEFWSQIVSPMKADIQNNAFPLAYHVLSSANHIPGALSELLRITNTPQGKSIIPKEIASVLNTTKSFTSHFQNIPWLESAYITLVFLIMQEYIIAESFGNIQKHIEENYPNLQYVIEKIEKVSPSKHPIDSFVYAVDTVNRILEI